MKLRVLVILFLGTVVMSVFSVIGNLVASHIWDSGLAKPYGTWISVLFIGLALVLFAISVWQFRVQSATPPEAASLDVARQFLQFLKQATQGVETTSPSASVTSVRAAGVGQEEKTNPFSQDADSLRLVLEDVGLTKWTTALSNSGYEPLECMDLAKRSLDFMGIAGSKWVAEVVVRNEFEEFLTRIRNRGGRVRFLMIDPQSDAFRTLRTMRGAARVKVVVA